MGLDKDAIKVAIFAAEKILGHAKGSPAQILAVGIAAGATFIGTGFGYGLYIGGGKLFDLLTPDRK